MSHPYRSRRMRQREGWRGLIREHRLSAEQLVMPLFVRPGSNIRAPIPAMPGQFQLSIDQLVKECRELQEVRVPAILLFGLADRKKDERAAGAWAKDGIIQRAVRALKAEVPGLLVITDVCLCAYTSHGHCGLLKKTRDPRPATRGQAKKGRSRVSSLESRVHPSVSIDEEATRQALAKTAVSHAQAGADMIAPSDMMDGSVGVIRQALDQAGFDETPILAYAAKFASALYAPFRTAVDSAPAFGDRRSYQLDVANQQEALRKAAHDLQDGADIVMVKPALGYLDVVQRIKETLRCPTAAFNVSGEYAMVKAAAARGWLAERPVWMEALLSMKRAGADVLITYWAKDAAKLLSET
ncbi:MAG: porphobilinogen synthase [Candidatus Omnitrophica bacterium]|nr:porphobilinogen synthase [Candidatus Omnitrophota bacterium]